MSNDSTYHRLFTPLSNPTVTSLDYPFSYIEEYDISSFCKGWVDEPPIDPGNFPNNIIEYYWICEGENDGDAWECIGKLSNNSYIYYSANCDYTGFDCQGIMRMHITMDPHKIYDLLAPYKINSILASK